MKDLLFNRTMPSTTVTVWMIDIYYCRASPSLIVNGESRFVVIYNPDIFSNQIMHRRHEASLATEMAILWRFPRASRYGVVGA